MTARTRPRRISAGVEIALAVVVGAGSFAVLAVVLAAIGSVTLAVTVGLLAIAGVIGVGRAFGTAYASPLAIAVLVAYDWYEFPPTHPHGLPNTEDLLNLIAYLAGGVLVGQIGALASRRAARSEAARAELAEEQAALRRVATLVAEGFAPGEVFGAVVRELGQLLGADSTYVARYEADGSAVGVAGWSPGGGHHLPIGTRFTPEGDNVTALVLRTRRPARVDRHEPTSSDPVVAMLHERGLFASVASPIIVDGRLQGVLVASSQMPGRPLPPVTEARIAAFGELVATALFNADARAETARLTDEQSALRRVATLVAQGVAPDDLFAAVARELGQLLGVDAAYLGRYEPDGSAVGVATWSRAGEHLPLGTRSQVQGANVTSLVWERRAPARLDRYPDPSDTIAALLHERGIASSVGAPIVVDGRLSGVLLASSRVPGRPLPPDTEARIAAFSELVATALSNIQTRADLDASRARLVEATDEERRRVVRDLHDGAQQRLVHNVIALKLALRALEHGDEDAPELMRDGIVQAESAMAELRELAHGILPAVLTSGGLCAGVDSLVSRMAVPVDVDVERGRLPSAVEATAYFVVAETLTNVAKHARASHATVTAHVKGGRLEVEVSDDGVGGAQAGGSGLQGLTDRVSVLNGRLSIQSPPGGGTVVTAEIPIA